MVVKQYHVHVRAAMRDGAHINGTEGRAVHHIALRASADQSYNVDGKNVVCNRSDQLPTYGMSLSLGVAY